MRRLASLVTVLGLVDACVGSVDDVGARLPGGSTDGTAKTYAPFRPVQATMIRLTQQQYQNSIADIFGAGVRTASPLESDELTTVFRSVGAAKVGTSERGVEQYRDAAFDIAAQVWKRKAQIPLLAACAPIKAADPCIAAWIGGIGLRLFRRPLTDEEVTRYARIVGADGEGADKLAVAMPYALAAMLQSPSFLYVVQVGENDPTTGGHRFSAYEMASRLAYFLWDSTPDVALLDAAAGGQLTTTEGIAAEVTRMLRAPRGRGLPARYVGESWKVAKLGDDSKRPAVYPLWSPALLGAYREELRRVVEDVVFARGGDLRDLFDLGETFANKDLAKAYGLNLTSADFVRTKLDDRRSGLLTAGAVLAANSPADRSSPTFRGVFVRERLLCQSIPAPPANVNSVLVKNAEQAMTRTVRQLLEAHRNNPACAPCHALFDPVGLVFESFDGIGVYRTSENGVAVDSSGELDGQPFRSVRDLTGALRADRRTADCLAKQLYEFAAGHEASEGEKGEVEALVDRFAEAKFDFRALVAHTAAGVGFRHLAPPPAGEMP